MAWASNYTTTRRGARIAAVKVEGVSLNLFSSPKSVEGGELQGHDPPVLEPRSGQARSHRPGVPHDDDSFALQTWRRMQPPACERSGRWQRGGEGGGFLPAPALII